MKKTGIRIKNHLWKNREDIVVGLIYYGFIVSITLWYIAGCIFLYWELYHFLLALNFQIEAQVKIILFTLGTMIAIASSGLVIWVLLLKVWYRVFDKVKPYLEWIDKDRVIEIK